MPLLKFDLSALGSDISSLEQNANGALEYLLAHLGEGMDLVWSGVVANV
jgi:hypothetical protein